MNRKNLIEKILSTNLNNELAQAAMRLFKSEFKSIKCVISLFLTFSICLSAYLTIQTLLSYLSYEVITTSRTLFESPAIFPKITFCNLNAFTSEYSVEYLKSINKKYEPLFDIFNENQMKTLNTDEKNRLISIICLKRYEWVPLQKLIKSKMIFG